MHENVACPRCGAYFECKVGNITQCQCQSVTLTEEDRTFIAGRYEGCLCAQCLQTLRNARKQEEREQVMRQFGKR